MVWFTQHLTSINYIWFKFWITHFIIWFILAWTSQIIIIHCCSSEYSNLLFVDDGDVSVMWHLHWSLCCTGHWDTHSLTPPLNIIQDNVLVPGLCCCHTASHCTVVSINPTTPPQHTLTHCAWLIQWYSDRYCQLTAQSLKTTLLRLVSRISSDSKFISHCFSY